MSGDRLILSASVLSDLHLELSPSNPLILEISCGTQTSFGIAWEFTAADGTFGMSAEKSKNFDLDGNRKFVLKRVDLSKGTFVQLTLMSQIKMGMDEYRYFKSKIY